jgi:Mce-associated membrane protein
VVAVLGVVTLVLVLLAGLGLFKWSWSDVRAQDAVDEASRTAPASAERASAAILSYGYTSLDADEKAAERYMTPAYKKKYADTFDRLVKPNATKLKAKVEAEVKASGVAHADADRVNVLLYVNQTTRSTANGGEPQVALNRVQLSMVKQGGTWLVNDITSY